MRLDAGRLRALSCLLPAHKSFSRFVYFNLTFIIICLSCAAAAQSQTAGSLDATFDSDGRATLDVETLHNHAFAVTVQADGKILVAGRAMITPLMGTNLRYFDFALARYHTGLVVEQNRAAFDFDGDGRSDISVFRGGNWFVQGSQSGFLSMPFGLPGDVPVPSTRLP